MNSRVAAHSAVPNRRSSPGAPAETRQQRAERRIVLSFLARIGLPALIGHVRPRSFLETVEIRGGILIVGDTAPASNVLHEAAHLACIPGQYRRYARGNLASVYRRMFVDLADEAPDSPLMRAALQCADPEATAWAWAAGLHLRLSPSTIISDDQYAGAGAEIRYALTARAYCGINGLAHAGLCEKRKYPQLVRWLQPVIAKTSLPSPEIQRAPR